MNYIDELHIYARDYHRRCEAYDRTVCTGGFGKGGGIMPATNREYILINSNASIQAGHYFMKASEFMIDKDIAQRILVEEA